jgi:hypothetical protein
MVRLLLQLKESGQIEGKRPADPAFHQRQGGTPGPGCTSFEVLLDLVDRLDCIETVRERLKDLDDGKGLSLEKAKDLVRKKYGIPF